MKAVAKSANATIRREGGYIQLHREIIKSAAFHSLSPLGRALYIEFELVWANSRYNNGRLSISVANAGKRLGVSRDTAGKAFAELASRGFIECANPEQWTQGRAREFRLTTQKHVGREPTDEWRNWKPGEQIFSLPAKTKHRA